MTKVFKQNFVLLLILLVLCFASLAVAGEGGGAGMGELGKIDIIAIFKKSFTLVILLGCSILALTFTMERLWYYRKVKAGNPEKFMRQLKELVENNGADQAVELCDKTKGAMPKILKIGLENRTKPKDDIMDVMASAQLEEKVRMEKFLGVLGTLGSSCPFIGLFGTVVGIIKAFHDLATAGEGGPSVVAAGIAEALVATAGGLLVAIPCVMVFNYFSKKVKVMLTEIEVASKRLMVYLGKE